MAKAFLLDMGRCIGCEACVIACKTGNELPEGLAYIELSEKVRGTFPNVEAGWDNHRCWHCQDAACVAVCPTGALFKDDGLTRLNRAACSGCEYCTIACPYDVPKMFEKKSSKCDACMDTTQAGGQPWCVKTCPSRALEFGDREEILAKARARAAELQVHYPNAQVYGETQAGGLGVIAVIPDNPENIGLPVDPEAPVMASMWQGLVQPISIGMIGVTAVGMGVAGVISRRRHMEEMQQLEAAGVGASGDDASAAPREEEV